MRWCSSCLPESLRLEQQLGVARINRLHGMKPGELVQPSGE
jgi:hypothetical protein